jgi:hypothetical protein
MTELTPLIPVATAAVAAGAALGAQGISGPIQRGNQERIERTQRRERAAEVLAEVTAFLTDVNPDQLGFNASKEWSREILKELEERRQRIRIPLLTLSGSHPSPEVRVLAGQLEVQLAKTMNRTMYFVLDLLMHRDVESIREDANRDHEHALRLLDLLLDAIHEPETGRPVGGGLFWRSRELQGRDSGR